MNYPKITIVTPTYNQGPYIEETIKSVLDQGYPNLEYIIMDGGSTDNTVEVIKKYQDQLAYWVSEKDEGQSDAINKGLKVATGDVFNWLNSDDYLEPGSLFEIGKQFQKSEVKMVWGGCRFFDHDTGETLHTEFTEPRTCIEQAFCHTTVLQPSMFYRMEVVREFNGVNKWLSYAMDRDLWFKFLSKYGIDGIIYSGKVFSNFRLHDASKTVAEDVHFDGDKYRILQTLFEQAGAPEYLIHYCHRFNLKKEYEYRWDFSKINKELLIAYYAERFCYKYLAVGDYERGRKCLNLAFRNGFPADSKFYRHLVKVNLYRGWLLGMLNKVKRNNNDVRESTAS